MKCRNLGPTPDLLNQNQRFNKIPSVSHALAEVAYEASLRCTRKWGKEYLPYETLRSKTDWEHCTQLRGWPLPRLSSPPSVTRTDDPLSTLIISPFPSLMTELSYNERKMLSARKCFLILQFILPPAESEEGVGGGEEAGAAWSSFQTSQLRPAVRAVSSEEKGKAIER